MNRFALLLLGSLAITPGCAHYAEPKTTREVGRGDGLGYTMQVDATRLERGTGLGAVAAVARLVEEDLAAYFRERSAAPATDTRREMVADAPAPGYGIHVVIEQRPDDYCFVSIDIVRWDEHGAMQVASLAPYSVQYGARAIRNALSSLRGANREALTPARFDELRAQATALASQNADPPIDEATFTRAPRSLTTNDDARYYAPPQSDGSSLRGPIGN